MELADALQREMATATGTCDQTASSLAALQAQVDETAAELSQVGVKVVGELQDRFGALEVQIADTVPALDAKIRSTEEELLGLLE